MPLILCSDADLSKPHTGDRSNRQALCKACHSRKTAREVFHRGGDGTLTN